MATTTSTTLACDVRTYISEKTLTVAEKALRMFQFGEKATLPQRHGTTFQYTRYDRLNLPQSTLTEGTNPTATTMSVSVVTAVAEQWGGLVTLTDVAELTIAHKPLQKGIELLGLQAAETIDREIYKVLLAGTNAWYGSHANDSNRAAIATNAVFNETTVRAVVADLRNKGARGMEPPKNAMDDPVLGDLYVGIIDPFNEMDIATFTGFINANQYADAKKLWNGEAGTLHGVRWVRSNHIPTLTSLAAVTATIATAAAGIAQGSGADASVRLGYVITGVAVSTGFESLISQIGTAVVATTVVASGQNISVALTMPTDTNYTYNVYVDTAISSAPTAGDERLVSSGNTAASAVTIASVAAATADLVPALLAAASSKVHTAFILGKEAYTVVSLQGLQSYLTPPTASDSDPLAQRRKAGWKVFFKATINNENYLARYEAESNFD